MFEKQAGLNFKVPKSQVTQRGQSDRGRCFRSSAGYLLGAGMCCDVLQCEFACQLLFGGSLVSRHAREVDEEVCVFPRVVWFSLSAAEFPGGAFQLQKAFEEEGF